MFSRVRNPKIMVRKSEHEGRHLFWVQFCVVEALLKGPFVSKIQSLKIDNCDALQKISFEFLKWHRIKPLQNPKTYLGICGILAIFILEIGDFSQNLAVKIRKNVGCAVYTMMVSFSPETIYPLIDRPQCQI